MADIDIEVKGLIELQRKAEQMVNDLHGAPILDAMRDSVLVIQRDARKNAPVDTGRLRASITPEVHTFNDEVQGVVGSNIEYAPYMEFGTRPHWPPISAIQVWADRHGISAFLIARAIARRGTKPRRYLQRAFESNQTAIIARFDRAVNQVVEK